MKMKTKKKENIKKRAGEQSKRDYEIEENRERIRKLNVEINMKIYQRWKEKLSL